jgi:hypothetical protein
MTVARAAFDHLTVAASSLEAGVAHVERCLGVVVPPGGAHPLMATHNHLMRLGEGAFLEIIAPIPAQDRSASGGSTSTTPPCVLASKSRRGRTHVRPSGTRHRR